MNAAQVLLSVLTNKYLLSFEDLLVREEDLVPHDLHPLLGVHGQRGAFHTWNITLAHLQGQTGAFRAKAKDNVNLQTF